MDLIRFNLWLLCSSVQLVGIASVIDVAIAPIRKSKQQFSHAGVFERSLKTIFCIRFLKHLVVVDETDQLQSFFVELYLKNIGNKKFYMRIIELI